MLNAFTNVRKKKIFCQNKKGPSTRLFHLIQLYITSTRTFIIPNINELKFLSPFQFITNINKQATCFFPYFLFC